MANPKNNSYVDSTNHFFKKNIYSNLGKLAFSPVSWAFETKPTLYYPMPNFGKLLLAALFAPVLVPATVATSAIAICLAAASAFLHLLSLAVAKIADVCSNRESKSEYELVSVPPV